MQNDDALLAGRSTILAFRFQFDAFAVLTDSQNGILQFVYSSLFHLLLVGRALSGVTKDRSLEAELVLAGALRAPTLAAQSFAGKVFLGLLRSHVLVGAFLLDTNVEDILELGIGELL